MPELFGHKYSIEELRQMTGGLSQIAGVRLMELADGKPRGMRAAEIYTGSGFRFQVLIDRGLDIGFAEQNGRPLAWIHPALGRPEQHEPLGYGWVRTFGGGLVTTCGLTHFGQPETDGAEALGLHGRISHMPPDHVRVTEEWRGDDYVLAIEAQVRQSVLFGENLLLTRHIVTRLGANSFTIEDTVRNDGFRPTPHMLLYHCNFGFPVVSPDSELIIDDEQVDPRDEPARQGLDRHTRFDRPSPDYAEQVFFHKPRVGADGFVRAAIVNRALNFGAYVRYRAAELPCFAQWKMMGAGDYVCALEPANYWETPRQKLRAEGRLRFLQPGEEVHYRLTIGVLEGHGAA
ncbi:MAG: aldose 1-epimerase family protein [Chloroflexi bacterium]|nr:aldose 1-epimerase family protein [Chloroflexota bacterium]